MGSNPTLSATLAISYRLLRNVLQAMIYRGVPAGMEAFRGAAEALDGEEQRAAVQSGDGPPHTPTMRPGTERRGDGRS